jgi:hypothetical protein
MMEEGLVQVGKKREEEEEEELQGEMMMMKGRMVLTHHC